jgi:hypothetical protein
MRISAGPRHSRSWSAAEQLEADDAYEAAVKEAIHETPETSAINPRPREVRRVVAADRLMGEALREPVNEERDAHDQSVAPAAVRGWLSKWLWRSSHSAFVPEEPKDKSGAALTERPICPTRRKPADDCGTVSFGAFWRAPV